MAIYAPVLVGSILDAQIVTKVSGGKYRSVADKSDTLFSPAMFSIARSRLPCLELTTVVRSEPGRAKVKYLQLCHLAKLREYYDSWVRSITCDIDVIHYQLLVIKVLRTYLVTFLVV